MSSHHIVRDEQEPALLLLAPEACPYEVIGQLLEWSPIVITTEEALDQVLELQVKVDVVFYSTLTKQALEEKLADQYPVKLIKQDNRTNLISSLAHYLQTRKQVALNIVAPANLQDTLKLAFTPNVAVVLFSGQSRSYKVSNGSFEKWAAAGQWFQVDALHLPLQTNNLAAHSTQKGLYQAQHDGFVSIQAHHPFWISEAVI